MTINMAHPVDDGKIPGINQPETILGVTISFLALACLAVTLRLYVRVKDQLWGWDDLFVFAAVVITTIGSILTCLMPNSGMGKHFWTLDNATVVEYFKHIWSTNITYAASTTLVKLSILFQYLRLFDMQSHFARMLTWAMIGLLTCWGLTFTLLALFSCHPIEKNWNFTVEGKCVAWGSKNPDIFFATFAAHSASNMLMDILVLVLPIPFLRGLRLGGKSRLGLIGLFTMGGIVAIISVARMIALSIKRAGTVPYFDPTFAAPAIYIFSVLEVNLAIICASVPIFWPLVTSLASNKILVVNEIEIRTDRRSSNIGLAEQGTFVGISDVDDGGRTSRMSTLIHGSDLKPARTHSRMGRSSSRPRFGHKHKASSASSITKSMGINIGIELGHRQSQESRRNLNLAHQDSSGTLSYSSSPDMDKEMDTPRNGSATHYQDRYVQGWACPDFERRTDEEREERGRGRGVETRVEKAELPYEHMRARET